jgi:hypothetical protein
MTQMTPELPQPWLTKSFRKAREQQAIACRARFELVINRGISPQEPPRRSPKGKRL